MAVICNKIVGCSYHDKCLHGKQHEPSDSQLRPGCESNPCSIYGKALCVPAGDEEDIT